LEGRLGYYPNEVDEMDPQVKKSDIFTFLIP